VCSYFFILIVSCSNVVRTRTRPRSRFGFTVLPGPDLGLGESEVESGIATHDSKKAGFM